MSFLKIAAMAAALAPAVLAVPAVDIEKRQCTGCSPPAMDSYCPVVDSSASISGDPWQAGVSVAGGSSKSYNTSLDSTWPTEIPPLSPIHNGTFSTF